MSHKLQAIDTAERAQILKLKSEQASAADANKKVEWLYSGDKIDKDAYLLGKPIDKLIIENESEKPKDVNPFSVVDLQSKIREDPLFEIKKREIEAKKRLLENPLKMKQLQETILKNSQQQARRERNSSDEDDRRHERRDDRDRKNRYDDRHRRGRSSSQEDRSSSRRNSSKKKHKKHKSRSRSRSSSREDSRNSKKPQPKFYSSSHSSSSKVYGLDDRRRERSPARDHHRSDADQPKSKTRAEIEEYKSRIDKLKQIRTNSSSTNDNRHRGSTGQSSKLSEEEKQRKLREMQDNARWRDDVRSKNVNKYKSDAAKDEEQQEVSKSSDSKAEASSFFNSMMRDAYVSAEDRIKRNVRNIQRNESAFDRNFARK